VVSTGRMLFLMPNQHCQSTEGNRLLICWFVDTSCTSQGCGHKSANIAIYPQPFVWCKPKPTINCKNCLWNRADHYIFILWFLLLVLLLSRLISAIAYFHTWCGLSVNLRCRSETCCMQLTENTGRKKVAKNRHLGTIAQLCQAISSQLRHVSTIGKKTF